MAEPEGSRADFSEMIGPRLAALALLLTACGGVVAVATPTPSCRPAPALAAPSASAAPVSATADQALVAPGGTVTFTEIADGPATVNVDCAQPLQVVVTDATGLTVYSGYSAGAPPSACNEVTLAAGAAETYQVSWPVDSSLPGGTYTATLVLGDAPELTLDLAVGALPGEC